MPDITKIASARKGIGMTAYIVSRGEMMSIAVSAAITNTMARVAYISAGPT